MEQRFDPPPAVPRPRLDPVPLLATSLTSAEMIKYAANAFLAMKIGFANEIANICERVGAEATEVMQGIGLDSRIGASSSTPASAGAEAASARTSVAAAHGPRVRLQPPAFRLSRSIAAQRQLVIQKLQEKLYILKGRTIALLGLAFKPDTDDLRDAPSLQICRAPVQMGARVRAYDPIAMPACRQNRPD